jgi:5-amino-6-(5-phosphoribosylamino)uracil reductase
VILSAAMSIDGFLDDDSSERLMLSNDEDFDRVDEARAGVDAIAVGAGTVRADDPRLLVRSEERRRRRRSEGLPPSPLRVVLSSSGDLDPEARVFTTEGAARLVYTTDAGLARFTGRVEAVSFGRHLDLRAVLDDLAERGVERLLVEGGGRVHTAFLAAGLADELHLAVAPFLLGNRGGAPFVHAAAFPHTPDRPFALAEVRRIGDIVLMHYQSA